jgi:MFS family permease
LLLSIAAVETISLTADFVAIRGLLSGASPGSWVAWPAWVFNLAGPPAYVLLFFTAMLFPDGRLLPGARWRWAAWAMFVIAAVAGVASAVVTVSPTQLTPRLPSVPNPLAVPALDALTNSSSPVPNISLLLVLGLVLAAVVVRFRRSRGVERSQLRWFAIAAAAALGLLVSFPIGAVVAPGQPRAQVATVVGTFGLTVLLPATIGLAIMRHGLYDIDVFISRTLVYGSLAVFITAVYVGIAVGIGALVGSGGKPNLGEDGDKLSVEVADDGRGFDVASTSRGNGLTNMEDRLDALGGTLYIVSSPGSGTTLRVILPVLTPAVLIKS